MATKDDIIKYVQHTPENTNPSVLGGLLSDLQEGKSIQPDWNQNDSTAVDYVKNRPFYTEDPVETVLLEEQIVTFDDRYSNTGFNFEPSHENIKHIKVTWDGTEYICIPRIFRSIIIFGNWFLQDEELEDTGEPFFYDGEYFLTASSADSHQIKVSKISNKIIQIDLSYIPNSNIRNGQGWFSTEEGNDTTASGNNSHAEGNDTTASGDSSHAEGNDTIASGNNSHAEGFVTIASGNNSHAEGSNTKAIRDGSHAEGFVTIASGNNSHAEGSYTLASSNNQHVQGKYNIEDTTNTYADIIGNGTSKKRSNAATVDWSGNAWYAGTIEGTALILPSSTANSTKKFKITVDDSGTISATEITA